MDRTNTGTLKITGSALSRLMDQRAEDGYCLDTEILMEDAACAALALLCEKRKPKTASSAVIFCGTGNNGGDGLALARLLVARRQVPVVVLVGNPSKDSLCGRQRERLKRAGCPILTGADFLANPCQTGTNSLVVDALLGTGLSRKPDGMMETLIQWINQQSCFVLSLDVPSGLDSDTGRAEGVCIKADATLGFGTLKKGLLINQGVKDSGELWFSPLSFPPALLEHEDFSCVNNPVKLADRAPDGHKGTFGKVLTVAGSVFYQGAPGFSAMAVLKAGAGISLLACPGSIVPAVAERCPELVFVPLAENGGMVSADAMDQVLNSLGGVKGMILGPGLSTSEASGLLIRKLSGSVSCPLLLDGDALTIMAAAPEVISSRSELTVLTPHPGEMARLLDCSVQEVESDREKALHRAVSRFGCPVVFKGHRTLIGFPGGRIFWNLTGNSGMATAGSGDILSGLIMGLFVSGNTWETAILAGVYIHGLAGDRAAETVGADSLTATDILNHCSSAVHDYRKGKLSPLVRII